MLCNAPGALLQTVEGISSLMQFAALLEALETILRHFKEAPMKNTIQFWRDMYEEALLELEGARSRFNHVDPNDKEAIDASIYSINSAEKLVTSALRQIKQIEEETLCLA